MRVDDVECVVCKGVVPCKGGGNTLCLRRDPQAHHIALILDSYGSTRTIVANRKSLKANVRHDELAHVVPGLLVHTPIAWNDIPIVIARAKLEFDKWLDTRPNLSEDMALAVRLYRLRGLRRRGSGEALDVYSMVWT